MARHPGTSALTGSSSFSPEELQGPSISLSGNLHPQQSFPEVSPLPPGDQLNLAISRVRDSKPPTLPFKSCDTRPGDTGIAPSFISALTTCNRGLGLNVSASRNSHLREFVSRTLVPPVAILRDAIGQR
jgi:hypothetical protein